MKRDPTFSIVIITVCRNEYSFQWYIICNHMTACLTKKFKLFRCNRTYFEQCICLINCSSKCRVRVFILKIDVQVQFNFNLMCIWMSGKGGDKSLTKVCVRLIFAQYLCSRGRGICLNWQLAMSNAPHFPEVGGVGDFVDWCIMVERGNGCWHFWLPDMVQIKAITFCICF